MIIGKRDCLESRVSKKILLQFLMHFEISYTILYLLKTIFECLKKFIYPQISMSEIQLYFKDKEISYLKFSAPYSSLPQQFVTKSLRCDQLHSYVRADHTVPDCWKQVSPRAGVEGRLVRTYVHGFLDASLQPPLIPVQHFGVGKVQ